MGQSMNDLAARLREIAGGNELTWGSDKAALRNAADVLDNALPLPTQGIEVEEIRDGLKAAIRAAKLAIFTINKQGVMPNCSWRCGFEKDLATAESVLSALSGGRNQ